MIGRTQMKKAMDASDYKLLAMAYPDIEKEVSYEDFKKGKVLAS